jgi:hypothetical protein
MRGPLELPAPARDAAMTMPAWVAAIPEPVRAADCVRALANVAGAYAELGRMPPPELLRALRLQLERLLVALRAEGWAA